MRKTLRTFGLLVALVGAAGCSAEKITEIVISVATDLKIPLELKTVGLDVERYTSDNIVLQNKWDVSVKPEEGYITLPATIGLLPQNDISEKMVITVSGFNTSKLNADVTRTARLPFVKDRVLWLRMNLLKRCLYKYCPPTQTCNDHGECEDIDKDPTKLLEYVPGLPIQHIDAGDGGPGDQGSPDAPVKLDGPVKLDKAVKLDKGSIDAPNDLTPPVDKALDTKPMPDTKPPPDTKPTPDIDPCPHPTATPSCTGGWCKVLAGCFTMGSPASELCHQNDEDLHEVTLTHDFEMMQLEVKQQDVTAFALATSKVTYIPYWTACGTDCPADLVNWYWAAAYCNELNTNPKHKCFDCSYTNGQNNKDHDTSITCSLATFYNVTKSYYDCPGYRLPTDAEWEYAYRAGTNTALYNGPILSCAGVCSNANKIGWYSGNNPTFPKARKMKGGQLAANKWGIQDLPGNMFEWNYDGYVQHLGTTPTKDPLFPGAKRVMRGGDYGNQVQYMRAANRADYLPTVRNWAIGFRCVRSLTNTTPRP